MIAGFWHKNKDSVLPLVLFLGAIITGCLGQFEVTSFFIYICPILLYFLVRRLKVWEAVPYGLNFGFYFAFSAYLWLTKFERFDPFIGVEIGYGLVFLIVFAVSAYLMRRYKEREFVQIFTFAWIFLVLQTVLHYLSVLGYGKAFIKLVNNPNYFDWVLPYFGSGMVDALVFALGFLIARYIDRYLRGESLKPLRWYSLGFAILLAIGVFRSITVPVRAASDRTVRVAAVQGNFGFEWQKRVTMAPEILNYFLTTTKEVASKGARVVVWPEYATAVDILTENPDMSKKIEAASKKLNVVIVLGSLEHAQPGDTTDKGIGYDLSLVYDPDKGRLEPYRAVYPYSSNIYHGKKPMVFETKFGNFPVLSCFEIARHKFVADYFHQGKPIDFIVGIANNQVFDGTYGPYRLMNHARRIAGENDRYVMYVTNTAPTSIINRESKVVASVPFQTQGYTLYDIEKNREISLYSRFQDMLPFVVSTAVFGFVLTKTKA